MKTWAGSKQSWVVLIMGSLFLAGWCLHSLLIRFDKLDTICLAVIAGCLVLQIWMYKRAKV